MSWLSRWLNKPVYKITKVKEDKTVGKLTPWGELPDYQTAAPKLTFADYVNKYLNKLNPATGRIWTHSETIAASGESQAAVMEYFKYATSEFYDAVVAGKPGLSDQELIEHWTAEHPVVARPAKPFMNMTVEELQQLYNRS